MNQNSNLPKIILFIDDDSTVGQGLEKPLLSYKVNTLNAQDLKTAFYYFDNENIDVVFVDLEFPDLHGLTLIQKFRAHKLLEKRACAFVLMSGKVRQASDDYLLRELMDVDLIIKPFSLVNVLPYLSRGLAIKQKLLKFEQFKEEIWKFYHQSKDPKSTVMQIMKREGEFGQRCVKFVCDFYEMLGLLDEGIKFITPYVDKDPTNTMYLQAKGHMLRLQKRYKQSLEFLEKAYANTPHNLQRLEDLTYSYLGVKEPEKAIKIMKELIVLNPENQDIKFELFKILSDSGYDDLAINFCKSTTKPIDIVRYYNNKGIQLSKDGKIHEAVKEYERALRYYPNFKDNYRIYYNLALAYIKLKTKKDYEKAIEYLQKCLVLEPNFNKAKNTLVSVQKTLQVVNNLTKVS